MYKNFKLLEKVFYFINLLKNKIMVLKNIKFFYLEILKMNLWSLDYEKYRLDNRMVFAFTIHVPFFACSISNFMKKGENA